MRTDWKKLWPALLVLGGIAIWMMAAGHKPTGDEDLYSIFNDDQYAAVLEQVQKLTQDPIMRHDEGQPLLPSQVDDLKKSTELIRRLIAYQPRNFGPYFVMAKVQKSLGNVDEAIRYGEQALLVVPTENQTQDELAVHAELAHEVAIYHYEVGNFARAEQLAETAVQIYGSNADYLATAATIKSQLGKLDDARVYVGMALAYDPKNATALELDAALKEKGH